jgi:hypothetical protein
MDVNCGFELQADVEQLAASRNQFVEIGAALEGGDRNK